MSEQKPEQNSGEASSVLAAPAAPNPSDASGTQMPDSTQASIVVDSPKLIPEQGESDIASGIDVPGTDAPATEAPRAPGNIMIMSSGRRSWHGNSAGSKSSSEQSSAVFGNRRVSALAAVVALAAVAGALGGALATAGLGHLVADDATTAGNRALQASVARIDADLLALKAGLENASKVGTTQFNKTSDRLDKVEKAQQEPAAKLARLSDAVEKLRVAAPAAPAAAVAPAAKEVTGSISPQAAAPSTAPKAEVARLPTVEGWALRDVANGGALIEGRQGIYEVYAGDPVPGLGRVDAIRRQDGRWVVVTSKGLIVAR